jgi:signal transduction histidine kinase
MLIAGVAVVGSAAGIAFAISLGEPWYSLIVTGAIVHVISGVAITLARGWGVAMRAETTEAQRAALVARTALTAEVVSIDASRRHAADILHSQVQTRLLAIADLLDFAAAGNDEDLQRARMEITNTCEDTLPEVVRVLTGADESEPSFDEIVRGSWPGVDVRGGEVIDSLETGDGVLMGVAFDACANAVRHGGASVVVISRELADDGERLCIRDNGSGVPGDMEPGLGLSAVAVYFPGWSITNSNGWTELALPLIADQVRGEPAIAR